MLVKTRMDDHELIELIKDYASDHKSFDTEFIDSISEAYEEYGELTGGQSDACENIVKRYRMEQWAKSKENVVTDGNYPWGRT